MSITQLRPPLALDTPLGSAVAHFIWTDGGDAVLYGCFQDATGENWWWPNHLVRLTVSVTDGRLRQSPIIESADLRKALAPHKRRHRRANG